eukprot:11223796-Lingulodinium_polyedra.AAC.1
MGCATSGCAGCCATAAWGCCAGPTGASAGDGVAGPWEQHPARSEQKLALVALHPRPWPELHLLP